MQIPIMNKREDFEIVMRKEDPGRPMAIPFREGYIGMVQVKPKAVGIPSGWKETFIYGPDGTMFGNYFLAYIVLSEEEKTWWWYPLFTAEQIADLIGTKSDAPYIKTFLLENMTSGNAGGVAVSIQPVHMAVRQLEDTNPTDYEDALLINNLYEYFVSVEEEEINNAWKIYQENVQKENSPAPLTMEMFAKTYQSTRSRIVKANPSVKEQCEGNFFIAAVISKLVQTLQRRYNAVNYDHASEKIADILRNTTYMNDNGQVVHLSLVSVNNLIEKAKGLVRIDAIVPTPHMETVVDPVKDAYKIV